MKIKLTQGFFNGTSALVALGLFVALILFPAPSLIRAQDEETPPLETPAPLRIVYSPLGGKKETLKKYQPFSSHMEKTLKRPVESICFDTHKEVYAVLASGKFDVAYMPPLPYVEAADVSKLEVVAMEHYTEDKTGYLSMIITKANPDNEKEGIVLAFTNPHSTSGYLVPQLYFLSVLKMPAEEVAKEIVFAGSHRAVIEGVYEGKYDMGATNDVDLAQMVRSKVVPEGAFAILWTSEIIPGSPICLRPDLPADTKKQIVGAIFMLNDNPKALESMSATGYSAATEKDYEIMATLKRLFKN